MRRNPAACVAPPLHIPEKQCTRQLRRETPQEPTALWPLADSVSTWSASDLEVLLENVGSVYPGRKFLYDSNYHLLWAVGKWLSIPAPGPRRQACWPYLGHGCRRWGGGGWAREAINRRPVDIAAPLSNNNLVTWVRRVAKRLALENLRLLWVHGCAAASTTAPILSAFNQDNESTKAHFKEVDVQRRCARSMWRLSTREVLLRTLSPTCSISEQRV